jgi:hypothetical protein
MKQLPIPNNSVTSNTNIEFDIEKGVYNSYYTQSKNFRICMSFADRKSAIEELENMKIKIELMIESMNINLDENNPKITSTNSPETKH